VLVNSEKTQLLMAEQRRGATELCREAGIAPPTLVKMLTGEEVRPISVGKIAAALNVPISSIAIPSALPFLNFASYETALAKQKMTESEAARRCGCSRQYLNVVRSGSCAISQKVLERLAKVLECSVEFLTEAEETV